MMSEKVSAKKNSKRERIIEAASLLFSERNFHEVMMTDVAQKASIAKGTLYNYYNSKEDLYFSIMLIRMENLISSLKKRIANETTELTALHSYIIHNYMFLMKYQCFFLMYQKENLNASNTICDELRNRNNELREILYEILCRGIENNTFRTVDEDLVTDLILGSIFAAVNRGIRNNYHSETQAEERERIFDFITNGLLNNAHPSINSMTILITRSENDADDFSAEVKDQQIFFMPTIEMVPSDNEQLFRELAESLKKDDYLILTSANSIRVLVQKFLEFNIVPDFSTIKVAAVGRKTAGECVQNAIPVHLVPETFSVEGLKKLFRSVPLKDQKILIPGSALSDEALPEFFRDQGAEVKSVDIYNLEIPSVEKIKSVLDNVSQAKPDIFVFTSPSSFRNYLKLLKVDNAEEYFRNRVIAAIGNTTKTEIEKHKANVALLPDENTLAGLGRAVKKYINNIPENS